MKKIASICMAILMAFSFMPWSVFAEDSESVAEDLEPAIEEVVEESDTGETPIDTEENENSVLLDEPDNEVKALASESDVISSGTCGDNLTWTLDNEGLLTISGTGDMYAFSMYGSPWYSNKDTVSRIVIENGVTNTSEIK